MQIFNITWKWNVPNVLSLVRILLVPVFLVLYLTRLDRWAFVVLVVSGVTDALDGFIARRFHQITDCGKLLDPISDKLTQMAVVAALATRYKELMPLAVLCIVKESCQAVGGVIMLRHRCEVRGSKWFGKVSTIVFYTCMSALVLLDLSGLVRWLLVGAAGLCMLVAFVGYLRIFIQASREGQPTSAEAMAEVSAEAEKG